MAIILAAIPLFFVLIGMELYFDKKRGTGYYRFNDAINSLQLGILSRISGVLTALIPFTVYVFCYQQFRFITLADDSYLTWIVAFVGYDLAYYWVHRLSHRINVMWASHVVHHSSEEYNLTTALRQTCTPALFAPLIYLPLAFIGVSPAVLVAVGALNLIYQFWVHTRHIERLEPWFEAIFVTPSHHRVHHALNRDYIDKNFAGVFILWDKWFGSFAAEKDDVPVVYGVSQQLGSWNPVWANFQVYTGLLKDSLATRHWVDKLKVWLKPPGWRPEDVKTSHPRFFVTTKTLAKYDVEIADKEKHYILFQHVCAILLVFGYLLSLEQLSLPLVIFLALFVVFSLFTIASLQEQRSFAFACEVGRLFATSGIIFWFLPAQLALVGGLGALTYLLLSLVLLVYTRSTDKIKAT